ncbi:MAG: cobalamin biosynthesis protein CobD, partial [Lachnospiraceae bacterium]|nr:cobalamin biosynthesis protein CobD [Lachnospiraceae bacterium]
WNSEDKETALKNGRYLVITVLFLTGLVSVVILAAGYIVNVYLGMVIEMLMTYQILSIKCLRVESMKVYKKLKEGDLEGAKHAVSMIVGRDVDMLDDEGIAKAAIETVAENTSDGCIAPMIYAAVGGPVLGLLYKAVNTMDSMVGYKNDKFLYFGRCAAKIDDIVNFIPSRISAFFMILASYISGKKFSGKNACKIYKRDRRKHSSPNSAQTESVCAGALGIRLAGDAYYFGKLVKKEYIGDFTRAVSFEDIKKVNLLLYVTVFLCEIVLSMIIMYVIFLL